MVVIVVPVMADIVMAVPAVIVLPGVVPMVPVVVVPVAVAMWLGVTASAYRVGCFQRCYRT